MIEIRSDAGQVSCKIDGNLSELLADAEYICKGLVNSLMDCGNSAKVPMATLCILQNIFARATEYAIAGMIESVPDSYDDSTEISDEYSDSSISSIKIDLGALKDWLDKHHSDDEDDE